MPTIDIIPKERRPVVRKAGYIGTAVMGVLAFAYVSTSHHSDRDALIVAGALIAMCITMIETWLALGMRKGNFVLGVIALVLFVGFKLFANAP